MKGSAQCPSVTASPLRPCPRVVTGRPLAQRGHALVSTFSCRWALGLFPVWSYCLWVPRWRPRTPVSPGRGPGGEITTSLRLRVSAFLDDGRSFSKVDLSSLHSSGVSEAGLLPESRSCSLAGRAWCPDSEGQPVGTHLGARLILARVTHEAGESLPASVQLSQWEVAFTSLATVLVPNRQARKAMLPLAERRQSGQKWGSP